MFLVKAANLITKSLLWTGCLPNIQLIFSWFRSTPERSGVFGTDACPMVSTSNSANFLKSSDCVHIKQTKARPEKEVLEARSEKRSENRL